jgi:hypothetical protein
MTKYSYGSDNVKKKRSIKGFFHTCFFRPSPFLAFLNALCPRLRLFSFRNFYLQTNPLSINESSRGTLND